MNTFAKIFPTTANYDYKGSPIAFFVLCGFGLMFIFRSLIHYLKEDGGAVKGSKRVSMRSRRDLSNSVR